MNEKYRQPILDQYKRVWLTKEDHQKLRVLKRKKKRTMAQIVSDLISDEYKRMKL